MTKTERRAIQEKVNEKVLSAYKVFDESFYPEHLRPFRSCHAQIGWNDKYIALYSFGTMVCFYERSTGNFFDVLRYVYGYTATSNQHIWKFFRDISEKYQYCGALKFDFYRYA